MPEVGLVKPHVSVSFPDCSRERERERGSCCRSHTVSKFFTPVLSLSLTHFIKTGMIRVEGLIPCKTLSLPQSLKNIYKANLVHVIVIQQGELLVH